MNPLISVIIPVYNVEKYLSRCLNSVITQTYQNIEIILINDGSTDDSLKIAQKFQKNDARIKLYSQKNQGLSGARNAGLKRATGDYITFIDSDDYVARDYVSYLYSLLKRNGFTSQLAICSLMDVFTVSGKEVNTGNNKEYTLSGKECIEKMCYQDLVDTCAYAKLGSKDLYKDFTFPVGKLFEDIGSTYKLFEKCKTVECGFFPKYYYNIRKDSITTRSFSKSKLDLLHQYIYPTILSSVPIFGYAFITDLETCNDEKLGSEYSVNIFCCKGQYGNNCKSFITPSPNNAES